MNRLTIQKKNPLVHVIILTWNHWQLTANCLHSVSQLTYPNFQTLVVDNGSTDDTVESIRQEFPGVKLLLNKENLGFAAGCNVGIKSALEAGADYVLLLNNDTVVPADLLDALVDQADQRRDAGVVTPMLRYLDDPDTLWFSGSKRNRLTLEASDFGPLGPRNQAPSGRGEPVDYVFGTALLIPRRVIEDVGLFDEAFFMYYEDMDFSLRLQRAGYGLYCTSDISVAHAVAASTDTLSAFRHYHKARSSVIFYRKHFHEGVRLFVLASRLGSALRTVGRLALGGQWSVLGAYLRGLVAGARYRSNLSSQYYS